MQAEVYGIQANDLPDWPNWSPANPADEFQWFTVAIGSVGDSGADNFQVAVATPLGLRERRRKRKFIGLVVDRFEPEVVEQAIRALVMDSQALTWAGIVELLQRRMSWEFAGYRT